MTDFYSAYKPLRNLVAQLEVLPSLVALWGYGIHVVHRSPLLPGLAPNRRPFTDIRQYLHPWDIELLVREVLLRGSDRRGQELTDWNVLAKVTNQLRKFDDISFGEGLDHPDVMLHLQRLAHRQFRWQGSALGLAPIIRALMVYGGTELDAMTQRKFGMTMLQLVQLSLATGGHFLGSAVMTTDRDFGELGISSDASRAYLEMITCSIPELRESLAPLQRYDHTWAYRWSPLEAKPLLRFDSRSPERVICPIPQFAIARGTASVFYDLVGTAGFSDKYGPAFETYVGETLRRSCPKEEFTVETVEPYAASKGKLKHGMDWIVSDGTAHLVIECKTKRMSLGAKQASSNDALTADIHALAEAVVQNYKNIRDAQAGEVAWRPWHTQIFPMVVTLEDWYLFSPRVTEALDAEVLALLDAHGIDSTVLTQMPFTVVSADELEIGSQVIGMVGVAEVLSKTTAANRRFWAVHSVLREYFPDQLRRAKQILFDDVAALIVPSMAV
jgi:hypothetical protein